MTFAFVLDASFAVASILPDEDIVAVDRIMDSLTTERALTTDLFWHELRNVLLIAERKKRLPPGGAETELAAFRALPIDAVPSAADAHVLALAKAHALTAYDAAYLHLAITRRLPLATLDAALAEAAKDAGVARV